MQASVDGPPFDTQLPFQTFNEIGQIATEISTVQYNCFLSLVELEHWLNEVAFFPFSTLTAAFQCSRYFQARFYPRPSLERPEGLGIQTSSVVGGCILIATEHCRHGRYGLSYMRKAVE